MRVGGGPRSYPKHSNAVRDGNTLAWMPLRHDNRPHHKRCSNVRLRSMNTNSGLDRFMACTSSEKRVLRRPISTYHSE